ncbi:hypothetical protein T484DRAFT_1950381 [Baffinella frigidus]|nr:hypothetical protein T484DRAFT_1950381 [Cryptophyta sp. CCMP2293]
MVHVAIAPPLTVAISALNPCPPPPEVKIARPAEHPAVTPPGEASRSTIVSVMTTSTPSDEG